MPWVPDHFAKGVLQQQVPHLKRGILDLDSLVEGIGFVLVVHEFEIKLYSDYKFKRIHQYAEVSGEHFGAVLVENVSETRTQAGTKVADQ
jgi:hypothetical protein